MKLENITSDIDAIYNIDPKTVLTVNVYFYEERNAIGHVHESKFLLEKRLSLREIVLECAKLMQAKGYKKVCFDSFEKKNIVFILSR